jgi:type IV pilus assembly protein PilB
MVGEIRDVETAQIALRAALTGHLVLSTLHTNSAAETIARLLDMDIEPYLITASVDLIIAQRLMRRICPKCRQEDTATDFQRKFLKKHGLDVSNLRFYKGAGCKTCDHTGYKGRFALFEVMPLGEEISEYVLQRRSAIDIQKRAMDLGLVTLQDRGLKKVKEGITSLDEWIRVAS